MKKFSNKFIYNLVPASIINGILFLIVIRFFDTIQNPLLIIASINAATAFIGTLLTYDFKPTTISKQSQ